jgi:REP element-mobilizing transposase RayT
MPDHLHWLFRLESGHSLQAVVRRVKGRSAFRINKNRQSVEPLWQPGFHDRVIRDDDSLADAGNYVIANPVRAGLVSNVQEWPVWGLMLDNYWERNRG